jgi:hypothetical protein
MVATDRAGTEMRTGRGRRIAFTIASAVFAAGAFGGLLGLGLVFGWFDHTDGGIHRVHDIGFGVLYGIILTTACVALAWRPERRVSAFYQVLATASAALIATLASAGARYLFFGVSVAVGAAILLALHPARREVLRPATNPSPAMAGLAVAGSVPLVGFGLTAARLQRTGFPFDPHVQNDHWATMAAMAFGLALVGLLASARMRGWRLTAWCAGLGAATYGLASVVFHRLPGSSVPYAGSEGVAWGLAAIAGGIVFVAVAEREARRMRPAG